MYTQHKTKHVDVIDTQWRISVLCVWGERRAKLFASFDMTFLYVSKAYTRFLFSLQSYLAVQTYVSNLRKLRYTDEMAGTSEARFLR